MPDFSGGTRGVLGHIKRARVPAKVISLRSYCIRSTDSLFNLNGTASLLGSRLDLPKQVHDSSCKRLNLPLRS